MPVCCEIFSGRFFGGLCCEQKLTHLHILSFWGRIGTSKSMEWIGSLLAPAPAPAAEAEGASSSAEPPPRAAEPAGEESFVSTDSTARAPLPEEQPTPSFNSEEKAVLDEPVPLADFGPVHERALSYMRWRRDAAVVAEPNLSPSEEVGRDDRLWRFAVAKHFENTVMSSLIL